MLQNLKIALLSKNQNVWFIRAEKGKYAKHFRSGGVIAIEHLERAYEGEIPDVLPTEEFLKERLLKNEKYSVFREFTDGVEFRKLNQSGFNLLHQVRRFANDIKCGDLIVTRNEKDDGYSFGICSDSVPYIDHDPVKLSKRNKDGSFGFERSELKYKLRKRVVWGPSISRSELPGAVRKATSGQQTVTNLNNHREKIFHLIYPFFTDGESLFFSNKIKTSHRVNAIAIGKLFQNVALIQSLSQILENEEFVNIDQLAKLIEKAMLLEQIETVTCQAEFMSPGDMWCRIPLGGALNSQIFASVLACLLLTGQVSAADIGSLAEHDNIPTLEVKSNDTIFNDRYKAVSRSPKLKAIAQAANAQAEKIDGESGDSSIVEVKKSLNLGITIVDTDKLEDFEYGISVLQIGRAHESR